MLFPLFTTDPKCLNASTRSNLLSDAKSHTDGNIFLGKILPKSHHENNLENKHLRLLIFPRKHLKKYINFQEVATELVSNHIQRQS